MVDDCFLPEVEKYKWNVMGGYMCRVIWCGPKELRKQSTLALHRFLWQLSGKALPENPLTIDHINGNRFDNRLENLRIASKTLQSLNATHRRKKHNLPRGVQFYGTKPLSKPYFSQITINRRRVNLGMFATPEEASAAYEAKRDELLAIEVEKSLSLSSPE